MAIESSQDNNKRIAKNTLLLYFRTIFIMFISLFTSRVVLGALGVEDYGIYNVVGGFVAMFSLVSSSLTSSRCPSTDIRTRYATTPNTVSTTTASPSYKAYLDTFDITPWIEEPDHKV